jgi:nucleoside-diphosphate-sugar epimerase
MNPFAAQDNQAVRPGSGERVLVTGGTGRIGRHLLEELVRRGYSVSALTSRPLSQTTKINSEVEWRSHDWRQSLDFSMHVEGCSAVLHLGAEIWDIPKMYRSNVEATQWLARAAETAGIRFFGYTSSIAVYGSPVRTIVTEDSQTLTVERDVRSEYLANDSLRAYGRSKLLGEIKLREEAAQVEYVILRPTIVVDIPEIIALGEWSVFRRIVSGRRHAHFVYAKDVVASLIWFMERALKRERSAPGVTVYNLSDDDIENGSYASFFRLAFLKTGDRKFHSRLHAPLFLYRILNMTKNRLITCRYSLGQMNFSPAKLYATGYRHPYGMAKTYDLVIETILRDASKGRLGSAPAQKHNVVG